MYKFYLTLIISLLALTARARAIDVQQVSEDFFPAITAVSFLPQNDSLVLIAQSSESWDSTKFFIRNVYTGEQNEVFYPSTKIRVGYMFLSPSGKYLAFIGDSLGENPRLCIVNTETKEVVHRQIYMFGNLSFSPDEKSIAYVKYNPHDFYRVYRTNFATDHTDRIFETGLSDNTLPNSKDFLYDVKYSPDGKYVYFNTDTKGLMKMDLEKEQCNFITYPAESIFSISPDGRFLAYTKGHPSVKDSSWIIIRNLTDNSIFDEVGGALSLYNIFFTSNIRYCAFIGGGGGKLFIYDFQNKSLNKCDQSIGGPIGDISPGLKWYVQGGGQYFRVYKINGDYVNIQETPNSNEIEVVPNPAGNQLNVNFSANQPGLWTFNIISDNGSIILTNSVNITSTGEQSIAIQTGIIPSGAYFLQVISNNFNAIKRVIINH